MAEKKGLCSECAGKSKAKVINLTRAARLLECRNCGKPTIMVEVRKK